MVAQSACSRNPSRDLLTLSLNNYTTLRGYASSPKTAHFFEPSMNDLDKPPRDAEPRGAAPMREVSTEELMQGQREIVIRHMGENYRLSVTRAGKLILRK